MLRSVRLSGLPAAACWVVRGCRGCGAIFLGMPVRHEYVQPEQTTVCGQKKLKVHIVNLPVYVSYRVRCQGKAARSLSVRLSLGFLSGASVAVDWNLQLAHPGVK